MIARLELETLASESSAWRKTATRERTDDDTRALAGNVEALVAECLRLRDIIDRAETICNMSTSGEARCDDLCEIFAELDGAG